MKLKSSIESQLQEIVFFFSLMMAFSLFLSGIFYLTLSHDSLTYILGSFGASLDSGLFSLLGYGFFYLSVISLHMGYITNFHVFSFRDFKKQSGLLSYSLLAHTIILVLFSVLLSVIQICLEIPSTDLLNHGSGGLVGIHLGQLLHSGMGVYGSVILLTLAMFITAIVAGFFELPEVFSTIKSASVTTRKATIKGFKTANTSLINGLQFVLRGNEITEAVANTPGNTTRWISNSWNKANHLITDHLHIYRRDEGELKKEAKKDDKKKVALKTAEKLSEKNAEKSSVAKALASKSAFSKTLKNIKKISLLDNTTSTKKSVAATSKAKSRKK